MTTTKTASVYRSIIKEFPFCLICGRTNDDRPGYWFGRWELHRAHVAAGQSKMIRLEDRRAIIPACPLCHLLHRTNGGQRVMVGGVQYPLLSNANVLWVKRERDPEWWDLEWLSEKWNGLIPDPVPPDDYFQQSFAARRA